MTERQRELRKKYANRAAMDAVLTHYHRAVFTTTKK